MNQSKQEWRAAMSEAVATVVSTATAAIRVAEANVRRARRAADLVAAGAVQETTMPGVYVVAATREYTADLNTGACTCPDQVNRGGGCASTCWPRMRFSRCFTGKRPRTQCRPSGWRLSPAGLKVA